MAGLFFKPEMRSLPKGHRSIAES